MDSLYLSLWDDVWDDVLVLIYPVKTILTFWQNIKQMKFNIILSFLHVIVNIAYGIKRDSHILNMTFFFFLTFRQTNEA